MKTLIERHGHWYLGCIDFIRGLWRLRLTQDLFSCKVGISFRVLYDVEITILFWAIDITRLTPMDAAFHECMAEPVDMSKLFNS